MMTEAVLDFWVPLVPASAVGDKPEAFRLFGEDLVVYRDGNEVLAFRDLCVHRGAALSKGWLTDGKLTCPYHGWQYDRKGICVAIPSLTAGAAIPSKARIAAFHAREAYGLVWVCRAEVPPAFPAWPDDAWNRSDFRVFMVNAYQWNATAERIVENALDFSHFNFAHRGFTELADGPVIREHPVTTDGDRVQTAYEDGRLHREYTVEFPFVLHDRKRVIAVGNGGTWSESDETRVDDVTTVTVIASPIDFETSRVFAYLSRNHSLDVADRDFAKDFDAVMEQDRTIVESQRPKLIPDDIAAELHVRHADVASIAYRRLFKR